ncbi:MAG: preprotein translocase subunit YajC [Acidimicrobiia bacterium]|nr:preprotein translocase subunit YajC [Acidimicrobiia bacterium]
MFSLILAAETTTTSSGGGGVLGLLPLILIFVVMYFLLLRPQRKRQKETAALQSAIQVNDSVLLTNGIIGLVTGVEDRFLWVEIAEGVQVQVVKGSVGSKVNMDGSPIAVPKPEKKAKRFGKQADADGDKK